MNYADVKMADIGNKSATLREAMVEARICLRPKTIKLIRSNKIPKGDVLNVARCSGILAAKRTGELIPLCHPLPLDFVGIDFKFNKSEIVISATCRTTAKTGVEMEAMAAASLSALTIYDMCKPVDRGAVIKEIKLMRKSGGKSGTYERSVK